MSDSVQTHWQQPTRLPCPWDSPGKNTGVGCHFLLQCMKVKSEGEVAQSCPTLNDSMDCSPPGSSVHGIFQAGVLEWGAIAFSNTSRQIYIKQIKKHFSQQFSFRGLWRILRVTSNIHKSDWNVDFFYKNTSYFTKYAFQAFIDYDIVFSNRVFFLSIFNRYFCKWSSWDLCVSSWLENIFQK